jgi:hypothetical protein
MCFLRSIVERAVLFFEKVDQLGAKVGHVIGNDAAF